MVTRGGRVDASGDLKKFVQMVAEGSVIYAAEAPRGGAPDVAPEGFSHPVFRAGFALAIPLSGQEGHPL
jgi:CRISPR/Cas system CSM-associated protein Csm4 (group 5 of RAMP superfamily)